MSNGNGTVIDRDPDSLGRDGGSLKSEFDGKQSLLHQSNQDGDSYTPPTSEEWKAMKGYGSFIMHDEDNVEHIFHLNDMIYVLPTGMDPQCQLDPDELWIAEIRSIRAHDSENVWIKAKWFYHPAELPKDVKGSTGRLKRFGTYERINSNQADFIPASSCCGLANIVPFNEQATEQDDIEEGILFYRYEYDWRARNLKNTPPPCSICKKAYNPDTDIIHFCPRPHCLRSWHVTCLSAANWIITSPVNLTQRLESLNSGWTPKGAFKDEQPAKRARLESSTLTVLLPPDPYEHVPPGLLAVARQPIARGGALGIVGNIRSVVRARKMLQEALEGRAEIPKDWEQQLGNVYDASAIAPPSMVGQITGRGKTKAFAYQCPQCGEPI